MPGHDDTLDFDALERVLSRIPDAMPLPWALGWPQSKRLHVGAEWRSRAPCGRRVLALVARVIREIHVRSAAVELDEIIHEAPRATPA